MNTMLSYYKASFSDCDLLFRWANDPTVRSNSFRQEEIEYEDHVQWLKAALNSGKCFIYIFTEDRIPVGQVRISKNELETIIGISIDRDFRGKSFAAQMLILAVDDYLAQFPEEHISAYIKGTNQASLTVFQKAGFNQLSPVTEQGIPSYKLVKSLA
ncbi:MAG: Acyl-CoA N-acyltransferase [Chitinophagaceae bacterium]|nr:Acyl-CoA N-acyltransferase [Chitinophagaceae bacterium]